MPNFSSKTPLSLFLVPFSLSKNMLLLPFSQGSELGFEPAYAVDFQFTSHGPIHACDMSHLVLLCIAHRQQDFCPAFANASFVGERFKMIENGRGRANRVLVRAGRGRNPSPSFLGNLLYVQDFRVRLSCLFSTVQRRVKACNLALP